METFYLLLLVPIFWAAFVRLVLNKTIDTLEMSVLIMVGIILTSIIYWSGMYSGMYDTEILNGKVTNKEQVRVHCRHSYNCNCKNVRLCSGSGKNHSCSTSRVCDTCYEHSHDFDWDVKSTLRTFSIDTIDRQGLREPPRWSAVKINDPVSVTHGYINYVKAVPDSLFHFNRAIVQDFKGNIPEYPSSIYDYYKLNRVLTVGVNLPDLGEWNNDISKILIDLGSAKQVNVVMIITNQKSSTYADALRASWVGGKKNDATIVIGVDESKNIIWTNVFAWTTEDLFQVKLRDDIKDIGNLDRQRIINTIQLNIAKYYNRKPMKDFEYLLDEIEPPAWIIWLAIIINLLSLGGLTYYFHKEDLTTSLFK